MHLVILGMVYISHSWWFLGWFIVGFTTIAVMAPVNRCWCEEWPNKSWGNWMKLNHSKKSLIQSYIIVVTEWNLVPWLSEGFLKLAAMCGRNPCSFRNSQRPADWSDHPSSATEDHLRDKRKAAKLPKHGRKRKRAQTLANKDRQRWRSKWITFNSMLEFRNVGKNRKACKTIGGSLIWCALDWSNKLPENGESLNKHRGIRLAEVAEMVIKPAG